MQHPVKFLFLFLAFHVICDRRVITIVVIVFMLGNTDARILGSTTKDSPNRSTN
jgi:hypothetical protein